jgi:hypothetical protein
MSWINTLLSSAAVGEAVSADSFDKSIVDRAPYDARKARRRGAENPVVRPSAQVSEEIKRRQISLITRCVATLRVR